MHKQPDKKKYFFCGMGGSGMSALAALCARGGVEVSGSDRAYDQGTSPQKFEEFRAQGFTLHPQTGEGVTDDVDRVVVSAAIEDTIPDISAAKAKGIEILTRARLLSDMFNGYDDGIAVAGTSGKSTVTGMVGTMLLHAGRDPSIMNGGFIKNFKNAPDHEGFANMRLGRSEVFVTECDESDGSIDLYSPAYAVLNNIALDHKPLSELKDLFGSFVSRALKGVVLNVDDSDAFALKDHSDKPVLTYGVSNKDADVVAENIELNPFDCHFDLKDKAAGQTHTVKLQVPGVHNVMNALAALCVAKLMGVPMIDAIEGLLKFTGIVRRFDVVGQKNDITVIDDFGHNPDKITATLKTLKVFDGRLLVMFQPHGFGPLKLMRRELVEAFASMLSGDDLLMMPEAFYAGGTADRSVTARDIIADLNEQGLRAHWFAKRPEILPFIHKEAQSGDRIIVMGARDDSLSDFAEEILSGL